MAESPTPAQQLKQAAARAAAVRAAAVAAANAVYQGQPAGAPATQVKP